MWEEPRWKVLCMYKWGVFIAKDTTWHLWLFEFPHDYLIFMNFWLYMTLHITCGSLGLPSYITLIYNSMDHSSDVADLIHDTTRHDNVGMFMMLVMSMLRCNAVEWGMCSWCIIASPLHEKVCRVFDGLGVHLMSHVHIAHSLLLWDAFHDHPCMKNSPHMYHPFVKKYPFMNHLLVKKYSRMHCLFVRLRTNLLACALLVHPICRHVMSYSCTCICNHSWWYGIKSINLLFYNDALSFAFECRWPGERTSYESAQGGFRAGMQAPGTTSGNCVEVTGRLRWTI